MQGLPDKVHVKKVRTPEEKDSVLSLLSSGEVDHQRSSFLINKVGPVCVSCRQIIDFIRSLSTNDNKRVMKLPSVRWPVRAGNCLLCVDVQRRL